MTDLQQCSGQSPHECMRMKGQIIEDQSTHATDCLDHEECSQHRLYWDAESYGLVHGGRAVSVETEASKGSIQYCAASEKTLSISHVWSHGQGGRPEREEFRGTGFNRCLHNRYCKLARENDCDSYWMDTPCIPRDHTLREEAINEINKIFIGSKMTIICDRDIMEIDVSDLSLALKERIVSVLLVCDWNLRAWTFLEAMRGRKDLRLLCKDDKLVSVKDLIAAVNSEGSLDLAILFFTAQHFTPLRTDAEVNKMTDLSLQHAKGFVSTEEAACLLNRRYATRTNDEVVIWSLLCGEDACHTSEAFWLNKRMGKGSRYSEVSLIHGGFLISSAPRLESEPGLGWAPAKPNPLPELQTDGDTKAFFPKDGYGSATCFLREEGLDGDWLIALFDTSLATENVLWWKFPFRYTASNLLMYDEVESVMAKYLTGFRYGALLQAARANQDIGPGEPTPYPVRGENGGSLMVVLGSNDADDGAPWVWRGVHEWPLTATVPRFERKQILIG